MKYYIIAGEASGDLHGSNLIRALRHEDPRAECRVWGGDLMAAAGAYLVKHYRDLAFMGFWEVLLNLRTILGNIAFCKKDIREFQPDALILVDYPGFNLRIAKWAKAQGLRVFYYISPQLWAWHSSRVHALKATVDRLFVILPFEPAFFQRYDYAVDFVGHPLLDVVDKRRPAPAFRQEFGLDSRPLVALLPGSRRQEISRMLEVMLQVAADFPKYQFAIAGAPSIPDEVYQAIVSQTGDRYDIGKALARVPLIRNRTYDLLQEADAAVVTSGTATLETALFGVPEVVCYKGSRLSYLIARRLVNIAYIALVNLIVDRPLLTELIQDDCTPRRISEELVRLFDPTHRRHILEGYAELRRRLGEAGASERTARLIVAAL